MGTDCELRGPRHKYRLRSTIAMCITVGVGVPIYLVARPVYVAGSWVAEKAAGLAFWRTRR